MINSTVAASRPIREWLFVLISIASFLLYALGVLTLRQDQSPGWGIEAQGPIPVALSHLVYDTPLGAVDYNMLMKFAHPNSASIQDVVVADGSGWPRCSRKNRTIPYSYCKPGTNTFRYIRPIPSTVSFT